MTEIIQHLQSEGYDVKSILPDGKIHRFKSSPTDTKDSAWAISYQNHTRDGDLFYLVIYSDWASNEAPKKYHTLKGKISAEDKKYIQAQVDKAVKKSEEERKALQEKTALECQAKWDKLSATGTSPYLERKKINGIDGLGIKFDAFTGDIYVPARDEFGAIWTLQKIGRDGAKKFTFGGRVMGSFHAIGELANATRIYICEGFATAASVRAASGAPAIVAFNSGNLKSVRDKIRGLYQSAEVVICGDDDIWAKRADGSFFNPGRLAAEECGDAVFPRFARLVEKETTDFNDLHVHEGLLKVREQLEEFVFTPKEKMALYALGFKEKEYFFTSTHNRQVVGVTKFAESDLYNLMPLNYWQLAFPGKTDNAVDWGLAKSTIMDECRRRGIFQDRNVRGAGVWNDEGRVIVNMGDHLIVDGERVEFGKIKSKYFYTLGARLHDLQRDYLTNEECTVLIQAADKFKWTAPDSGILLAGALICSRVCGALPIRPHLWITGGALTGKTTLFESLVNKVMGPNKIYVFSNTTEAGVRQAVKANAVPVLFDEFETTDKHSGERVGQLIELMRASWSESGATIVKGGATGNASYYQVRFSAIVSSIRTKLNNDADRGRFAVVELAPHGSDQEHWKELTQLLIQIDDEYCEKLFSRTVKLLPVLLKNYKLLKKSFSTRVNSRFGDQYGMILAGYSILIQEEPMSESDAEWLVDQIQLDTEKSEAKEADHDDALNHLLSTGIMTEYDTGRREMLIYDLITSVHASISKTHGVANDAENLALTNLGIRVDPDFVAIFSANHSLLENRVWRNTKWSQSWGNSLRRIPGVVANKDIRIGSKKAKCVRIPVAHIVSRK